MSTAGYYAFKALIKAWSWIEYYRGSSPLECSCEAKVLMSIVSSAKSKRHGNPPSANVDAVNHNSNEKANSSSPTKEASTNLIDKFMKDDNMNNNDSSNNHENSCSESKGKETESLKNTGNSGIDEPLEERVKKMRSLFTYLANMFPPHDHQYVIPVPSLSENNKHRKMPSYRVQVNPDLKSTPFVIYLHGGAFYSGDVETYLPIMVPWFVQNKMNGVIVEYPLCPEHTITEAMDFLVDKIYDQYVLKELKVPSNQVVFCGDSAGGGLSVLGISSILKRQQQENTVPLPKCLVIFSPWLDLTLSTESFKNNDKDVVLDDVFVDFATKYNPLKTSIMGNPLDQDMSQSPPIFVSVGTIERLYDESKIFVEKCKKANISIELETAKDLCHDYQMFHLFIPEAEETLRKAAKFIHSHCQGNKQN